MVTIACDDCLKDVVSNFEYFMLKDEIWQSIAMSDAILCVGCTEDRLGRQLTPEDFADVPCNHMHEIFPKNPMLLDRMGRL